MLGAAFEVTFGSTNGGTFWNTTNATAPVIGTDAITWIQFTPSAPGASGNGNLKFSGSFIKQGNTVTANIPIAWFISGKPTNSQIVCVFNAPFQITLPASLTGSVGKAYTAATGSTTFDIQVNAVSKGSIVFAGSGTVPTYTFSTAVVMAAGDVLKIVAPSSADATLADIGVTLYGSG